MRRTNRISDLMLMLVSLLPHALTWKCYRWENCRHLSYSSVLHTEELSHTFCGGQRIFVTYYSYWFCCFLTKWARGQGINVYCTVWVKKKRRYTKTDFSAWLLIASLVYFNLVVHTYMYSAIDGCTVINFVKHVKIVFSAVCAAWWHLQELSQQSNSSCIRTVLCTMTKLGWRQFWHALQKWLMSSHPWPSSNDQCSIWKKNMLSSTDNNFMILIFDF